MSVQSIAKAYAQYGPEGLTEKGKNVRIACIAGATVGTALVITGIVIFILLQMSCLHGYSSLFPTTGSVLGGCAASGGCAGAGLCTIILSSGVLNTGTKEYVEPNPQVKHPLVKPDPRDINL